jgi:hypothetical protein
MQRSTALSAAPRIRSLRDDHDGAVDIIVVPRTVGILEGAALEVDPHPDSFSSFGAHPLTTSKTYATIPTANKTKTATARC